MFRSCAEQLPASLVVGVAAGALPERGFGWSHTFERLLQIYETLPDEAQAALPLGF